MSDWNGTILGPPHVCIVRYIENSLLTLYTECPREPHLQRQDPLRPKLPRRTSRDLIHIQNQPAMCQRAEWKGEYHNIDLQRHLLTGIGRSVKAALLSPMEEGLHHGDHTHRASKVMGLVKCRVID
jgi:hypothetical protein